MTKLEKEVIREEVMGCVGHYVNDAQLEIYIEDQEEREREEEEDRKEFEDKVLDLLYERHDYFHNYIESERKMYNEEFNTDFEYPEDLLIHLWEVEKDDYFFELIKDILFDAPIELNDTDKDIIVNLWDAIRHRMFCHNKFNV